MLYPYLFLTRSSLPRHLAALCLGVYVRPYIPFLRHLFHLFLLLIDLIDTISPPSSGPVRLC